MSDVTTNEAVGQLLAVLKEAFEGSDQGWTYFTDSGGESAISGDRSPRNWPESWGVSTVNDAGWRQMQEQIRERYQTLRQAIESSATVDEEAFGAAVGAVAHMAYHLGAIRQKLAFKSSETR